VTQRRRAAVDWPDLVDGEIPAKARAPTCSPWPSAPLGVYVEPEVAPSCGGARHGGTATWQRSAW
jgi:hypothetical protein